MKLNLSCVSLSGTIETFFFFFLISTVPYITHSEPLSKQTLKKYFSLILPYFSVCVLFTGSHDFILFTYGCWNNSCECIVFYSFFLIRPEEYTWYSVFMLIFVSVLLVYMHTSKTVLQVSFPTYSYIRLCSQLEYIPFTQGTPDLGSWSDASFLFWEGTNTTVKINYLWNLTVYKGFLTFPQWFYFLTIFQQYFNK